MYAESGIKWNTESRVYCFILYVWYGLEVRVLVLDIIILVSGNQDSNAWMYVTRSKIIVAYLLV